MTKRWQPYVWVLTRMDTMSQQAFTAEHLAMHAAETMVGNRAVCVVQDMMLYGPGDGTTSVMIRRYDRDEAVRADIPGVI